MGRTGRGTSKGLAISFCSKEERELLEKIEAQLGKNIYRTELSGEHYRDTIASSRENDMSDWQSLLDQEEAFKKNARKKKARKKKARKKKHK